MPRAGDNATPEEVEAMLHHVDAAGRTYSKREADAAGLPGNISHTYCKECYTRRKRITEPMEASSREVRRMGYAAEEAKD